MQKALDTFSELTHLNIFCFLNTTERGGSRCPINNNFLASGDFRRQPFFAQLRSFPKLRTLCILDHPDTKFSIKDGEDYVEVGLEKAKSWMQSKLVAENSISYPIH